MKIKSLHQDNHTKLLWHSKTFERTLEKTILYYHLNIYRVFHGILQHCKHIVRLNVWFRSLSGFSCSLFECDISQSCFALFGLTLNWVFVVWTYCAFTTVSGFLYSCINMCKQAESSFSADLTKKYIELRNWMTYGELLLENRIQDNPFFSLSKQNGADNNWQ